MILLLTSFDNGAMAAGCPSKLDTFVPEAFASDCFASHVVLQRFVRQLTPSGQQPSIWQRRLDSKQFEPSTVFGVAFGAARQACVLTLSRDATARFVAGYSLQDSFLASLSKNLLSHLRSLADDDCVMHIYLDNQKAVTMVIVYFLNRPAKDGRTQGLFGVKTTTNPEATYRKIDDLGHPSRANAIGLAHQRNQLSLLAEFILNGDTKLLSLNTLGAVFGSTSPPKHFKALAFLIAPLRAIRICTQEEMQQRYRKPLGELRELVGLSNERIAREFYPSNKTNLSGIDVAAYAICD